MVWRLLVGCGSRSRAGNISLFYPVPLFCELSSYLVVLHKGLSEEGESGEPIIKLLILDDHSVEILVISSCTKSGIKAVHLKLRSPASPVVSLETFLHVSRELGQILGFIENSTEQDYGDLIIRDLKI